MDSVNKGYVSDRKDIPAMEFEYNHTSANLAAVKAYISLTEQKDFLLVYQDKSAAKFTGTGATWINDYNAGTAGKCTMTVNCTFLDDNIPDATSMLVNPNPTLGTLTVVSAEGATTGNTHITVTPTLTSGNKYKYETSATVSLPAYDADVSALTNWDGSTDITAVTGNQILIVESTSDNKAVKAGIATVTSKA